MSKKIYLFILYIMLNILTYSIQLSTVEGLNKLSNYNEIKNINVKRIYEKKVTDSVFNRENGITYIKGEKIPFDGIMIARENRNILRIYQYSNGKNTGISNDYYKNGQLYIKVNSINDKAEGESIVYYENGKLKGERIYKNDIIIKSTEYYQSGKLRRTFESTGGLNGVITGYYENGVKSSVQNVTQDYSVRGEISYISNGQALVYDKKGTLIADLNYKNDSIIGLQQKFYVNGKLKYDLIAASEDPKNFKAMDYAIEYYDNSDIIKLDCREKERGKGKWTCKEYNKNGSFKREFDSPTYKFKQSGTKDWINYLLPVLKLLTGW